MMIQPLGHDTQPKKHRKGGGKLQERQWQVSCIPLEKTDTSHGSKPAVLSLRSLSSLLSKKVGECNRPSLWPWPMGGGVTDDWLKGTKVKITGSSKHPSLFRPPSTLLAGLEGSVGSGWLFYPPWWNFPPSAVVPRNSVCANTVQWGTPNRFVQRTAHSLCSPRKKGWEKNPAVHRNVRDLWQTLPAISCFLGWEETLVEERFVFTKLP